MVMRRILPVAICSILTLVSMCHAAEKGVSFTTLTQKGSTSKPTLKKWTVRSKGDCAVACASNPRCLSFSVGSSNKNCTLYAGKITDQDVIPAPTAEKEERFYVLQQSGCPYSRGYTIIPTTSKCVRLDISLQTWTQAQAVCQADGGHLISIQDLDTWTAVRAYLEGATQDDSSIYVGGYKGSGGQWRWLDGSVVGDTLWYPGNPDGGSLDTCLQLWWWMRAYNFLLVDDVLCNKSKPFLCEV